MSGAGASPIARTRMLPARLRSAGLPAARAHAPSFLRRHWEAILITAIALAYVWMRFIDMQTSLWGDEVATAVRIDHGLSAIYTNYTPNDHILYSILSWLTVSVLGHHEPVYRIWSVLPAIASSAALFWWTRLRLGKVAAFALAGILLTAPMVLQWTVQARGYGMAQLGMVLTFVAGAEIEERGVRRGWLALLAIGILVGASSHYASAPGLGLVVLWLLRRRDIRRPVFLAGVAGALGVVLILSPVIPSILHAAEHAHGELKRARALGLKSLITGPIELGSGNGQLLLTGHYTRSCAVNCYTTSQLAEWGGPLFLAALLGAGSLWRARRRGLLGCLLAPLLGSFAFVIAARIRVDARFMMYLFPIYATIAAVGLAALVNEIARRVVPLRVLAVLGAALFVVGFGRVYSYNQMLADNPANDFKGLADAFTGSGIATAVTNMPPSEGYGLTWYLPGRVTYENPAALQTQLCGTAQRFAFIQGILPISTQALSCLQQRHATAQDFSGGGALLRLWLVASPGQTAFSKHKVSIPCPAVPTGPTRLVCPPS